MNKKLAILVSIALILQVAITSYVVFESLQKDMAYIDSGKLLNEYKGMLEARKAYQLKSSAWQSNLDTLSNEIEQMIVEHERKSTEMNVRERANSESLIQKKQQQLIDYQRAIRDQAAEADANMTNKVLLEVNEFLKTYGEKSGYKIILAATNSGNIVYASEGLDITQEVLTELNKNFVANE